VSDQAHITHKEIATMYCRICGHTHGLKFYPAKRQTLCKFCAKDTPAKVGRLEFDQAYWTPSIADNGDTVACDAPESTRREFYADYLTSNDNLAEYIAHTTSARM
jgi:hypothetical protein